MDDIPHRGDGLSEEDYLWVLSCSQCWELRLELLRPDQVHQLLLGQPLDLGH